MARCGASQAIFCRTNLTTKWRSRSKRQKPRRHSRETQRRCFWKSSAGGTPVRPQNGGESWHRCDLCSLSWRLDIRGSSLSASNSTLSTVGPHWLTTPSTRTCAMRMSIALAKAGVVLTKGGLRIQAGPHKGRRAEPSMRKLASHLAEMWGAPEKYDGGESARKAIGHRKGVVAFFFGSTLPLVGAQGHIDIISPRPSGFIECAGACFFSPLNKVWFWPLQ